MVHGTVGDLQQYAVGGAKYQLWRHDVTDTECQARGGNL